MANRPRDFYEQHPDLYCPRCYILYDDDWVAPTLAASAQKQFRKWSWRIVCFQCAITVRLGRVPITAPIFERLDFIPLVADTDPVQRVRRYRGRSHKKKTGNGRPARLSLGLVQKNPISRGASPLPGTKGNG